MGENQLKFRSRIFWVNFPANALFEWDVKPLADMIKTYDEVISIFKRYADAEG